MRDIMIAFMQSIWVGNQSGYYLIFTVTAMLNQKVNTNRLQTFILLTIIKFNIQFYNKYVF